jgi:outer membrane murein-binding lipoprotein Lpp
MKIKHIGIVSRIGATLAATLLLAGCASTGYDKGNITAANIQATSDRIAALPGQLDETVTSLNNLVSSPQPDLRPQYQQFAANVDTVEATSKSIAADRQAMGEKGKDYLAAWDQQIAQIQNPDIKAVAQGRRDQVTQQLVTVKKSYVVACDAFKPFLSDMKDVQSYLSVDLTTAGLTAVQPQVAKANRDVIPLKASLNQLAADFKTLATAMSSFTPPTTPQ